MYNWRSATKEPPLVGEPVLGITSEDRLIVVYRDIDNKWRVEFNNEPIEITYWLSLPLLIP